MKDWYNGLDARERLLLVAGSSVLVLFLFYALVLAPFHSGYQSLRDGVTEQRVTAVWIQENAQTVTRLKRSSGSAAKGLGGRSLLAVTDSTARAGGLGSVLKRVEPEGNNNVRVWLDGASFDVMIKWLGSLDTQYGIVADNVTLERAGATGRVNARLTLQASL